AAWPEHLSGGIARALSDARVAVIGIGLRADASPQEFEAEHLHPRVHQRVGGIPVDGEHAARSLDGDPQTPVLAEALDLDHLSRRAAEPGVLVHDLAWRVAVATIDGHSEHRRALV